MDRGGAWGDDPPGTQGWPADGPAARGAGRGWGSPDAGWDGPDQHGWDSPDRTSRSHADDPGDWGDGDGQGFGAGGSRRTPDSVEVPAGGVVQPPLVLLVGAVVAPLLALPLLALANPGVHVLGWALAVFGSLGLVLAFTARDLRASASPWYGGTPEAAPLLRIAAVVLGIGVAAVHAWFFADWASRLDVFAR